MTTRLGTIVLCSPVVFLTGPGLEESTLCHLCLVNLRGGSLSSVRAVGGLGEVNLQTSP